MSWVGRIVSVLHEGDEYPRDAMVLEVLPDNKLRVTYHGRREEVVTLGEEAMFLHENQDALGTIRRAPRGFAHAILLDQGGHERCWLIVDAYGPMEIVAEDEVHDWVPVYTPEHDRKWRIQRAR